MSLVNLNELAAQIPNGAKLVIAKDESGVAMADRKSTRLNSSHG